MNSTCYKRLRKESQTAESDGDEYVQLFVDSENLKKYVNENQIKLCRCFLYTSVYSLLVIFTVTLTI